MCGGHYKNIKLPSFHVMSYNNCKTVVELDNLLTVYPVGVCICSFLERHDVLALHQAGLLPPWLNAAYTRGEKRRIKAWVAACLRDIKSKAHQITLVLRVFSDQYGAQIEPAFRQRAHNMFGQDLPHHVTALKSLIETINLLLRWSPDHIVELTTYTDRTYKVDQLSSRTDRLQLLSITATVARHLFLFAERWVHVLKYVTQFQVDITNTLLSLQTAHGRTIVNELAFLGNAEILAILED